MDSPNVPLNENRSSKTWILLFSGICTLVVGLLGFLVNYFSQTRRDASPLPSATPFPATQRIIAQVTPTPLSMEASPSAPVALSNRSVLLLRPVAIASTAQSRAMTATFTAHIEDRIKSALLGTGRVEIVNRDHLEPIDRELKYIEELSLINGQPSLTAEAYRVAAGHGARWIFAPFVSIEPERYSQEALRGPELSSVTVRIAVYVCDLMSRAWISPSFEGTRKSAPEYAPKTDPPVRHSQVISLIDSVSEKLFVTAEFEKWVNETRDK